MCFKDFLLNETYVNDSFPGTLFFVSMIRMKCFLLSMSRTTTLTLSKLFGPGKTVAHLSLGTSRHLPLFIPCPFVFLLKT